MKQEELSELLDSLKRWKTEGRKMILRLEQPGRTRLNVEMGACASLESVPENADGEVSFSFGWGTAHGVLSFPLSNGIVSCSIRRPGEPSPVGRVSSDFEACLKFTWGESPDYCSVCVFPKDKP